MFREGAAHCFVAGPSAVRLRFVLDAMLAEVLVVGTNLPTPYSPLAGCFLYFSGIRATYSGAWLNVA